MLVECKWLLMPSVKNLLSELKMTLFSNKLCTLALVKENKRWVFRG